MRANDTWQQHQKAGSAAAVRTGKVNQEEPAPPPSRSGPGTRSSRRSTSEGPRGKSRTTPATPRRRLSTRASTLRSRRSRRPSTFWTGRAHRRGGSCADGKVAVRTLSSPESALARQSHLNRMSCASRPVKGSVTLQTLKSTRRSATKPIRSAAPGWFEQPEATPVNFCSTRGGGIPCYCISVRRDQPH